MFNSLTPHIVKYNDHANYYFVEIHKMDSSKTICLNWMKSLEKHDDEQCLVVAPMRNNSIGSMSIPEACMLFSLFSLKSIETALHKHMMEYPDSKITPPLGRVALVLCHSNNMLSVLEHAGIPGRYNGCDTFKNSFISNFRSMAHLRTANFTNSDDPVYCMTYAQAFKLLRNINVNLITRQKKGEDISTATLAFATHIVMIDAWVPTIDTVTFIRMYDTLASYGCAMPRIAHISQATNVVGSRSQNSFRMYNMILGVDNVNHTASRQFKIRSTVLLNVSGELTTLKYNAMINNMADTISAMSNSGTINVHSDGYVYLIVPDIQAYHAISKLCYSNIISNGWKFYEHDTEGFAIKIIVADIAQENVINHPEAIFIVPALRVGNRYEYMSMGRIGSIVRLTGSYVDSNGQPIRLVVPYDMPSPVQFCEIDPYDSSIFPHANYRQLNDEFVKKLPLDTKEKMVCQFAEASVQCTSLLPDAVTSAAARGLIQCVGIGPEMRIVSILNRGIVTCKGNACGEIITLVNKWKTLPYGHFPIYCACAIIERCIGNQESIITAGIENTARVAKELHIDDPFVHQMRTIIEYVTIHGLEIVTKTAVESICVKYGADPSLLIASISRVLALRAIFGGQLTYGPFDPLKIVQIMKDHKMFKIAFPKATSGNVAIYTVADDPMQYIIPNGNPYVRPSKIMIMHAILQRKCGYESNGIPTSEIALYSAVT